MEKILSSLCGVIERNYGRGLVEKRFYTAFDDCSEDSGSGTFYFLLLDDYLIGTFEDSLIV